MSAPQSGSKRKRPKKRRGRATGGPASARKPRAARSPAQPPSRRRTWTSLGLAGRLSVALSAVAGTIAAALLLLLAWGSLGGSGSGRRIVVDWPAGVGAAEAAARLQQAGVTSRPLLLSLYLRAFGRVGEFAAGPHLLDDRLSARELTQRLARAAPRPTARVTVPEGWSSLQIAARLDEKDIVEKEVFLAAVRDRALLGELSIQGESAEGYLFPATYELAVDSDARAIVRRLVSEARERLARVEQAHPGARAALEKSHGFSERDVVTLASIVEKEARRDDERGKIASVYLNRLVDPEFRPRRTLQADPTAAYGCALEPERAASCADFAGKVTPGMLRDSDNRWNTYKHAGLPPGPIANPGEASLAAVLAAERTEYLFFVHTGEGRHTFSRTLAEHDAAMQ